MRIPLDYYRILGLPLAASEEQLRQAYSDRIQQMPRREYSQAAINSRKQLIEEAYVVLSDPKERRAYDKLYLSHAYGSEGDRNAAVAVENRFGNQNDGNNQSLSPSIEINQEELVGALLILQELGEYELVLNLGRPYLVNKHGAVVGANISPDEDEFSDEVAKRSDIYLTVALACLELGREEWQQGRYENAAVSLETGEQLLAREGLFPNVRAEIQADLNRLRPYRILELIALPEEQARERRKGLQLLQQALEERGGIDGPGDDQSGLNIDDFLRFIQQLRNYLTVEEQHKLFEAESNRPSAVATYLAVYALIARGFTQRQAALIRQAKQMLIPLGKRQDVHLEQSLCALLLGQTEEATRALELSQEYEALVFIREHSQNSPDLLPGLCLYGERWLQNEVFPHFRNLKKQHASLKEYFADQRVQAYLEQLSTQAETTNPGIAINRQPHPYTPPHTQTNHHNHSGNSTMVYGQFSHNRTNVGRTPEPQNPNNYEDSQYPSSQFPASPTPSPTRNTEAETPVTPHYRAERVGRGSDRYGNNAAAHSIPPQPQPQRRRRHNTPSTPSEHMGRRRRTITRTATPRKRLIWIILTALASIFFLWLLISTALGLLQNIFSPAPALEGEQLLVQVNEPPLPIPNRDSKPMLSEGLLTNATAEEVIRTWLSAKAAALGPNYEIDSLENILVGSALAQWQKVAQLDKANNRYRQYEHNVKIEYLDASPTQLNQAAVEASVTEVAKFYENGQINQEKSYDETVRVRYILIRKDGNWRIREMSVLNKV